MTGGTTSTPGPNPASRRRIGVVGAGAVGSYIGGMLYRAGADVTLVDQWPEHVVAIRERGLRIAGTVDGGTVPVPALHLHELQSTPGPFDVVLIAVKGYDTEWATTLAAQYLSQDGVAVVCQNGITDQRVAAIVGPARTLGCVITIAVALFDPGRVERTDRYDIGFRIGELDHHPTPRVEELVSLFQPAGGAMATVNLAGERWAKLAINCMVNAIAGITGLGAGEIRARADVLPVIVQLAAETIRVAGAHGVEVEPLMGIDASAFLEAAQGRGTESLGAELRRRSRSTSRHPPSLLQDVRKGRRTEIDDLNGFVAREGDRIGIPTPFSAEVARIVTEAGVGGLRPDPGNLRRLRALLA